MFQLIAGGIQHAASFGDMPSLSSTRRRCHTPTFNHGCGERAEYALGFAADFLVLGSEECEVRLLILVNLRIDTFVNLLCFAQIRLEGALFFELPLLTILRLPLAILALLAAHFGEPVEVLEDVITTIVLLQIKTCLTVDVFFVGPRLG